MFWVDERVVPRNHPDSNYKLANDNFLSKVNDSLCFTLVDCFDRQKVIVGFSKFSHLMGFSASRMCFVALDAE